MTSRMEMIRAAQAKLQADRAGTPNQRFDRNNAWFKDACYSPGANISMLCRLKKLRDLEIYLTTVMEPATSIDWDIACLLARAAGARPHTSEDVTPPYTVSLNEARSFVAGVLPGFWVSSGLCALTGHASIGPDYNGPEGARLHREWPAELTPCDWSEDLAPGDGPHRECMAILACAVRALAHKLQLET